MSALLVKCWILFLALVISFYDPEIMSFLKADKTLIIITHKELNILDWGY